MENLDLNLLIKIQTQVNNDYIVRETEKNQLLLKISELNDTLNENSQVIDIKEKVSMLLLTSSESAREQAKVGLEVMVTNALQFILQEDISFSIEFNTKRKRPEATFYIVSDNDSVQVKNEPEDERGGGIVDIVSTALRISIAHYFNIEGPIFLDEPARNLSQEYMPAFTQFIKTIAERFNRQIIIVTHKMILAECGDTIYNVTKKQGTSIVEKIR